VQDQPKQDQQPAAASETPKIEVLLEEVVKRKASDLHLQVGLPPMLRIDGALTPLYAAQLLTEEVVEGLVFTLLDEDQKQILLRDKEFDFSFAFGNLGRFRVNAFHERGNLAAAMRLINTDVATVEQLGLPPVVNKFANYPRGLVLITGPTGSGKSTTLAALVDKINTERAVHIITIEDPIEYTHKSKKSMIVQREVHYDTYSFSTALRSSLREDPDVVLIGEMRDLETIASAITIAETGHLVLATLHTNSASQSIDRMVDVFPPHQQPQVRSQLGNILQAICSQRLVPALGGGRVVAAEILVATPAVRNIIREGKNYQLEAIIQTGSEYGMQSMDRTLVNLIHGGVISYDEARNFAIDIEELDRLMRG
jgi:twitching motility protein PilT